MLENILIIDFKKNKWEDITINEQVNKITLKNIRNISSEDDFNNFCRKLSQWPNIEVVIGDDIIEVGEDCETNEEEKAYNAVFDVLARAFTNSETAVREIYFNNICVSEENYKKLSTLLIQHKTLESILFNVFGNNFPNLIEELTELAKNNKNITNIDIQYTISHFHLNFPKNASELQKNLQNNRKYKKYKQKMSAMQDEDNDVLLLIHYYFGFFKLNPDSEFNIKLANILTNVDIIKIDPETKKYTIACLLLRTNKSPDSKRLQTHYFNCLKDIKGVSLKTLEEIVGVDRIIAGSELKIMIKKW